MIDCDKCSLCCRFFGKLPKMEPFDRGDGVCIHLKNNICEIYEDRPTICNIKKIYQDIFKDIITEEEYIRLSYKGCDTLKETSKKGLIMSERNDKLVEVASKYVGVKEIGDNRGEMVEKFQKAVDGKAQGESWCLSYVFYCIKEVDSAFDELAMQTLKERHTLFETEHCITLWDKNKDKRIDKPFPGCLIVWQFYKDNKPTSLGHVGIVKEVVGEKVKTIEGNTSSSESVDREGGGVFEKLRRIKVDEGPMRVLGFINPWK